MLNRLFAVGLICQNLISGRPGIRRGRIAGYLGVVALLAAAHAQIGAANSSANFGSVNVGASSTQTITFNDGGSASYPYYQSYSVKVLTQGATGLDFTNTGTGSCTGNIRASSICTVAVAFAPNAPGLRMGMVELLDGSGNVLAMTNVYGVGIGPLTIFEPGSVSTIAGGFNSPSGAAVDGSGNIYVADFSNKAVKEIPVGCTSSSCVTIVGGGIGQPTKLAVDGAGNLYVPDGGSLKEIPPGCTSSSCVVTVISGFNNLYGVALDGSGIVYVADYYGGVLEKIPVGCTSQSCVTAVGGGFSGLLDVVADGSGNLYVADKNNHAIKQMPAGCVSASCVVTLGGGFTSPFGVAVDASGTVYIADYSGSVLEMPAGCASSTCVTTLANLSTPTGVALDGKGNLLVGNTGSSLISIDRSDAPSFNFATTTVGAISSDSPKVVMLRNIGSQALTFPVPTTGSNPAFNTQNFPLANGSATICPQLTSSYTGAAPTLASGASCTYGFTFAPKNVGSLTDTATLSDTSLNLNPATQAIALSGTATGDSSVSAGSSTITITPSTLVVGSYATVTVHLVNAGGYGIQGVPVQVQASPHNGGSPQFLSSGITIAYGTSDSNGNVILSITDSTAEGDSVSALAYPGAPNTLSLTAFPTVTFVQPTYLVTTLTDDATGKAANCVPLAVDNSGGNSACSLRDAIAAANVVPSSVGATINFWSGTPGLSAATQANPAVYFISGNNAPTGGGTLSLIGSITLNGPTSGTGSSLVNLLAIDGGGTTGGGVQVLYINTGTPGVALNNLIVRNGVASSSNEGGGIYVAARAVSLTNATVSGNSTSTPGNASTGYGGGLYINSGTVVLDQTTVPGNNTSSDDNSAGGGMYVNGGTVTLLDTTLAGNTAVMDDDLPDGGGLYVQNGSVTLIQTTITGNNVVDDVPVSQSSGIYVAGGSVAVFNSLVTDGYSGVGLSSTQGNVTSGATLSALGFYGGPTQTFLPEPGSAAICAGISTKLPSGITIPLTDQRGVATGAGGYCAKGVDTGAVQTDYAFSFGNIPTTIQAGSSFSPQPAVALTENGLAFTASSPVLTVTDTASPTALTGTFGSTLGISGTTAATSDALTATMVLNSIQSTSLQATSSSFSITQPPPTVALAISAPTAVYQNLSFNVTVTAQDPNGKANPNYTGTVSFSSSDSAAVLPGSYTFVAGDGGTHTFSVTLLTAGNQTITATDTVTTSLTATASVSASTPGLVVTTAVDDNSPVGECGSSPTNGPTACRANVLLEALTNCGQASAPNYTPTGCSLRDALETAEVLGTAKITFDPTVFASAQTISVGKYGTLTVPSYTTIHGPTSGSSSTLTNLVTIDGGRLVGLIDTGSSTNVTLNNLILQNGNGGGISGAGTSVTVNQCSIINNVAASGGGIYVASGSMTINRSTVSGNTANASSYGGGGGLYIAGGTVAINDTTIANNTVSQGGGGTNAGGTVILHNSTVTMNLVNTTDPDPGGGIYSNGGTVTLYNSLVEGNTSEQSPDTFGVTDGGGNLYGAAGSGATNPQLSALGNYGGPTQTTVPLPGSAAICAAVTSNVTPAIGSNQSFADQRGAVHGANYCSASQLDAGAVQTSYALGFSNIPASIVAGSSFSPQPAVAITENGFSFTASSPSITIGDTASPSALTGSYGSSLGISGTTAATSDALTAAVALNASPAVSLLATSSSFSITLPAPTVTGVTPAGGPMAGGTAVTITGTYFSGTPVVQFGSVAATGVFLVNATTLTATTPPGTGTSNVAVTIGGQTATLNNAFTYYAPQVYTVTTLVDDPAGVAGNCPNGVITGDTCSLRDAIAAGNLLDGALATINFAGTLTSGATQASPAVASVATGGAISITGAVTINGPTSGSGLSQANLLAVDGGGDNQLFTINAGNNTVTLNDLVLQRGHVSGAGGGIEVSSGVVAIQNSTLANNFSNDPALGGGGMDVADGTVTLSNSTISGNQAEHGGGLFLRGGTLTVINSTVAGNSAYGAGGILVSGGTLTLSNATISGNTASSLGNGLTVSGASVVMYNTLDLDSSFGYAVPSGQGNVTSGTSISPLGYYGGPTQAVLPLPGSSAICAGLLSTAAGSPASVSVFADQRLATHSADYCSTSQLDAGAVQTSYSLGSTFTVQPPSVVSPGVVITPNPVVTVTENSIGFGGAPVTMSASSGTVGGTTSANSAATTGLTTFNNLTLTGAQPGDYLTATLALNPVSTPLASISLNSSTFNSLTLSAPSTLTGQAGVVYSQSVTPQNGTGPYLYTVTSTVQLPGGLTLGSASGTISGTPRAVGSFLVTVQVTDTGSSATASVSFMLVIQAPTIVVGPSSLPVLTVGLTPSISFTAGGGTATYSYALGGTSLPDGLVLNTATGAVTGTPTSAGSYSFTVTVIDSTTGMGSPFAVSLSYSGMVQQGMATIQLGQLSPTYNALPQAVTVMTVPANLTTVGLSYSGTTAAGAMYGPSATAPTAAGSYSVTATLTNTNYSGTQTDALTINPALLTITANSTSRAYGTANPMFTGSYSNNQGTDTFTESFMTSASSTSVPGAYAIVPSATGSNLTDYTVSAINGTLTVVKANTTTTLVPTSLQITPTGSVTLTATVVSATTGTPTGTVTFYDGATQLGNPVMLLGGQAQYILQAASITPGVQHVFTAQYAGDGLDFNGSASVGGAGSTVTVSPNDFTIALNTGQSFTVVPGQSISYSFQVSPLYAQYPGPVTFAATGLPPGATAVFTPASIPANGGAQTVTLTINTVLATNHLPRRELAPIAFGLLLLPVLGLRRSRRRLLSVFAMLLLTAGLMTGLTGCGLPNGIFGQAPQNYTVTVTATSGTTSHASTFTLNVQ